MSPGCSPKTLGYNWPVPKQFPAPDKMPLLPDLGVWENFDENQKIEQRVTSAGSFREMVSLVKNSHSLYAKYTFKRTLPKAVCQLVGAQRAVAEEIAETLPIIASPEETMSASVAATFRILVDKWHFDEDSVMNALESVLCEYTSTLVVPLAKVAGTDVTMSVLAAEVELVTKVLRGDKFQFQVDRKHYALDVSVKKCFFYDYMKCRGLAKLTRRTFCSADHRFGQELAQTGSFHYSRPSVIPNGCSSCKFKFRSAQRSDDIKPVAAWT